MLNLCLTVFILFIFCDKKYHKELSNFKHIVTSFFIVLVDASEFLLHNCINGDRNELTGYSSNTRHSPPHIPGYMSPQAVTNDM